MSSLKQWKNAKDAPKFYKIGKKRSKPRQSHRLKVAEAYIQDIMKFLSLNGLYDSFDEYFDQLVFDKDWQCKSSFVKKYGFYAEAASKVAAAGQVEGFVEDGELRAE